MLQLGCFCHTHRCNGGKSTKNYFQALNRFDDMDASLSTILPISFFSLVSLLMTYGIVCKTWIRNKNSYTNPYEFANAWQFSISKAAFLGAGLIPFSCMVLYYAFVLHIRLSLGRWPHFGETLAGEALKLHHTAAITAYAGCIFSLYVVGIIALLGFAFKRMRWLSFSSLIHMVFAGISFGSLFLAPHQFLNWLFD